MSAISSMVKLGLDIQSAVMNPDGIKDPEKLSKVCNIAKIALVAMAIITAVASVLTGPLGLVVGGAVLVGLYDAYRMAGNIQKVAEDKKDGVGFTDHGPEQVKAVLGKGTVLVKPILGLALKRDVAKARV